MGRKNTQIIKNCQVCNRSFSVIFFRKDKVRFCSRECSYVLNNNFQLHSQKGVRNNTGRTLFRNGHGKSWFGTRTSYINLHKKIRSKLGKAFWCTWCFSMQNVEWANLSHKYIENNPNDWIQLCKKCHFRYDTGVNYG